MQDDSPQDQQEAPTDPNAWDHVEPVSTFIQREWSRLLYKIPR